MSNQQESAKLYQATLTSIMKQHNVDRPAARKIYKKMGGKLAKAPESISVPQSLLTYDEVIKLSDTKCAEIEATISARNDEIHHLKQELKGWEAIKNSKSTD